MTAAIVLQCVVLIERHDLKAPLHSEGVSILFDDGMQSSIPEFKGIQYYDLMDVNRIIRDKVLRELEHRTTAMTPRIHALWYSIDKKPYFIDSHVQRIHRFTGQRELEEYLQEAEPKAPQTFFPRGVWPRVQPEGPQSKPASITDYYRQSP